MPTRSRRLVARVAIAALALCAIGEIAAAQRPGSVRYKSDPAAKARRALEGVDINEKLGARLPLDIRLYNERGAVVRLGDFFETGLPVLLTFNYSNCPLLCSTQLGFLTRAIVDIPYTDDIVKTMPGKQFHIVTVSLDPKETSVSMSKMKAGYVRRFDDADRPYIHKGWHFLSGSEQNVRALADAVGFGYKYRKGDWLHPAALIFVSASGVVVRYVNGIDYDAKIVSESVFLAGTNEPSASVGFLQHCFSFDSTEGDHSELSFRIMRYAGAGFVMLLLMALGIWQLLRRRKRRESAAS